MIYASVRLINIKIYSYIFYTVTNFIAIHSNQSTKMVNSSFTGARKNEFKSLVWNSSAQTFDRLNQVKRDKITKEKFHLRHAHLG